MFDLRITISDLRFKDNVSKELGRYEILDIRGKIKGLKIDYDY